MAAQYTSKMQSLFVESVQVAHDLFQTTRDHFHGHPYSSTALATNARGCDLDDPSLPRQPDGSITKPPLGGLGCPACAGNVNMRSPSHARDPRHCRWNDKDDYHWECPSCKQNYGKNKLGHVLAPGKCKFANPWKLPDNHGQIPPVLAEPAAGLALPGPAE
eukprot:4206755-Pyramimonas_sp.AAC.1